MMLTDVLTAFGKEKQEALNGRHPAKRDIEDSADFHSQALLMPRLKNASPNWSSSHKFPHIPPHSLMSSPSTVLHPSSVPIDEIEPYSKHPTFQLIYLHLTSMQL